MLWSEIFTTIGLGNDRNDNIRYSRWHKFDENDDISILVIQRTKNVGADD